MLVMQEESIPPVRSHWCGDYDFTEDEITKILEAFDDCELVDETITTTYFKCESERWSIYINNPGGASLLAGFILGWQHCKENFDEGMNFERNHEGEEEE